mgnify:CR=1 FL=1
MFDVDKMAGTNFVKGPCDQGVVGRRFKPLNLFDNANHSVDDTRTRPRKPDLSRV